MFLPDISIRRPVLAWVITLLIIIVGVVGYQALSVREMPDVDFPIVTVSVTWRGAAPDVMETEVTDLIEEEINTIEGIKTILSQTREERAQITVEFELEIDVDVAAQDVRDAIARVRRRLPDDINEPVVVKLDLDAQPIMWVSINSDWMGRTQLADYADRYIKDRLQVLPGVGRIQVGGAQDFALRIELDAARLAAHGLTVSDVATALRRENVELPSGRIESVLQEFVVRTQGRLERPDLFNDLIITSRNGTPIRIRDVGEAVAGVRNERNLARFMQTPTMGMGVLRQSQANTLDVANRVAAELARIQPELPEGIDLQLAFDGSRFIQESVTSTLQTLVLAAVLVVIVIFIFLRSLRSSFIPAVTIPVAVLGTFGVMNALGFSINIITLLGLILAIGLLVDDAIVMLENIYRHMEQEHEDPIQAARNGAAEIGFAVIASSITLAAVFIPVAFVTGMIGVFFFEFGLTVASAIFISTLIALTLTPMLCSRIIRVKKRHMKIYHALERGFDKIGAVYTYLLERALRHRIAVVVIALLTFGGGLYMGSVLPGEFAPRQDQSTIIAFLRGPEGATLEYIDRYLKEVESIVADIPEVNTFMAIVGMGGGPPNRGIMFITLSEPYERDRDQFEIMAEMRRRTADIPGLMVLLRERSPFGGRQDTRPVQYVIQHPDLDTLATGSEELARRLRDTPGFLDVDTDLELNKPELVVHIDRDRAAVLGISVSDVSEALQILIGGLDVTDYKERGKQYDVIVRLREEDRRQPRNLEQIYFRSRGGDLVPLSNLARFEEAVGPSQINHYNRVRSVTVSANLEDLALSDALDTVRDMAQEIFPAETTYALAGTARDMAESFRALTFTLALAIVVVFLVLAAQFNSWIHPFTIMLGLPLALVGAFGGLWMTGQSLNIFSFIGLIMLTGLVTKNGILLIDYTNRKRDEGMDRDEAVMLSGNVRLRPILMTALTTIFGVLPIALGLGAGGEARAPLGIVVIGGMTVSTLLTLVVVPVIYTLLDDLMTRLKRFTVERENPNG